MNKNIIMAAAAAAVLTLTSCGTIGRVDPTTITKKNEGERTDSALDDVSEAADSIADSETDSSVAENNGEQTENEKQSEKVQSVVDAAMSSMSVEEKVGQLFIVRPDAFESDFSAETVNSDNVGGVTFVDDLMKESMDKYHVGGVIIYSKNMEDEEQLKTLIEDLQKESDYPLFMTVEEEGGRFSQIAGSDGFDVEIYDSMASVGASGDTEQAETVGNTIGGYLKEYGFNLDLAPVTDVFSNPNNNIIGDRSFSNDPQTAADMVTAEIKGFHEEQVMTAVKHFPGHGDVSGGLNGVMAVTSKDWVELMECDLIPFTAAFSETDMVMAGHITASNVTKDGLPASLSNEMITGKLRGELGYSGVVISDSMSADCITAAYNSGESAIRAISAGVDIILMPYDLDGAYTAVLEAVENGTISEERLDESVERILTLKAEYGLIK